MPAPRTSTDRIDDDWPLTVTPASRQRVARRRESDLRRSHREQRDDPEDRAAVDEDQQHEHEQPTAASSSVPLMLSKTLMASAENPAGPSP